MPEMDIQILETTSEGIWGDINELSEGSLSHLPNSLWKVAIISEGMGSGLPSVALRLDLPDGRVVIAETSLALWSAVTIAGRARFPVAFAGSPLEVPEE